RHENDQSEELYFFHGLSRSILALLFPSSNTFESIARFGFFLSNTSLSIVRFDGSADGGVGGVAVTAGGGVGGAAVGSGEGGGVGSGVGCRAGAFAGTAAFGDDVTLAVGGGGGGVGSTFGGSGFSGSRGSWSIRSRSSVNRRGTGP